MSSIGVRIPDDHARNLIDPTAYGDGRIHETYAWLRANNPFGLAEVEGFDPFWVATKHADILDRIWAEKQLSDELRGQLHDAISTFAKTFV